MLKENLYKKENYIPAFRFKQCFNHFFHKQCISQQLQSEKVNDDSYIVRCCICNKQYGSRYGDMPNGEMSWTRRKQEDCEGYEGAGCYQIIYKIQDVSYKDGSKYLDYKVYLPGNTQGKKWLALLILLFQHRFTFQTAKLINNPDKVSTFWGQIQHKSNTKGGGPNGFPDFNYLNDLISGCRTLGISCDEKDDINKLIKENSTLKVTKVEGQLEPKFKYSNVVTNQGETSS